MAKIYGLYSTEPDCGGVRYIGQTKTSLENRLKKHITNARKGIHYHLYNWIRSVYERGYEIKIELLKDNAVWNYDEIELIKKYKELGANLTNATAGGDGSYSLSEESRRKISESKIGKKYSEDARKNISLSKSGCNHPLFGKHHSEETRKKMSAARLGIVFTEEHRANISAAKKGIPLSKENLEKLRSLRYLRRGYRHSDESRKKMSMAAKGNKNWIGKKHSPENLEKCRAARKKWWASRKYNSSLATE